MKEVLAVIDTNVLVSSMLSNKKDTATVKVLDCITSNRIVPVFNNEILKEYEEVLRRPKFKFKQEKVDEMLLMVKTFGISMSRTEFEEHMIDEKDRVFYEVSLTGDSYLVTGNTKHFPITPKVVTPSEMMDIIDTIDELERG